MGSSTHLSTTNLVAAAMPPPTSAARRSTGKRTRPAVTPPPPARRNRGARPTAANRTRASPGSQCRLVQGQGFAGIILAGFTLSMQKKKFSPCEPCCGGDGAREASERRPPIMPPKKSKAYVPARACAHDDARLLRLLSRVPGVSCRVFFILARSQQRSLNMPVRALSYKHARFWRVHVRTQESALVR